MIYSIYQSVFPGAVCFASGVRNRARQKALCALSNPFCPTNYCLLYFIFSSCYPHTLLIFYTNTRVPTYVHNSQVKHAPLTVRRVGKCNCRIRFWLNYPYGRVAIFHRQLFKELFFVAVVLLFSLRVNYWQILRCAFFAPPLSFVNVANLVLKLCFVGNSPCSKIVMICHVQLSKVPSN